jgi:hypothetical protein
MQISGTFFSRLGRVGFHRCGLIAAFLAMAGAAWPQTAQTATGALRGQIADESGAVIPDAAITLTSTAGESQAVKSGPDGAFSATGLRPGSYTVRVVITGFAVFEKRGIQITAGQTQTLNVPLRISLGKQEVTVEDQSGATVSTDPANNAGALILRGEDLEALPDDPDDLESDLQALAGPFARSGSTRIPSRPNMTTWVLDASRSSPSPGRINFTARRFSTSATNR